jgi:hypothetical protein
LPKQQRFHLLEAVIRFLSDFRAKTDNRSRTYRRRYWFERGMVVINFLYVVTTSSWLYGFFAVIGVRNAQRQPEVIFT